MPVDAVRRSVAVELVPDVDEMLDRGDIDVVDRGEVKYYGFEFRSTRVIGCFLAAAWARIVPRTVLEMVSIVELRSQMWMNLPQVVGMKRHSFCESLQI